MKNLLLIFILIIGSAYFFVPYETKVELLEKAGIDSGFLPVEEIETVKADAVDLEFDKNNKGKFDGNISAGEIMEDLSWASGPYVKCFYSDNYKNFNGNTVLHRVVLPKNKDVVVKLITENKNLNMYVYKTDVFSKVFPPKKDYVFDCNIALSASNKIIEMKGNTAPSDIVVGVTGANGILEGNYTLEIEKK